MQLSCNSDSHQSIYETGYYDKHVLEIITAAALPQDAYMRDV